MKTSPGWTMRIMVTYSSHLIVTGDVEEKEQITELSLEYLLENR
jgi:hypothetical protein